MAESRTRIIFVDDEPRILDGLRRQFRFKRHQWDMRFASSGDDAIQLINQQPPDVIVSDMRMPGMNGDQLLSRVRAISPRTVRLVLSGQTDQSQLLMSIGAIHQYLQKPCDPNIIDHAVYRTCELASSIESDRLRDLVSSVESLPVLSDTYVSLCEALQDERTDFDDIAGIVRNDVGLSTKILQMVNSAFFGLPRKMTDVKPAISLIGIQRIKHIAIASKIIDSLSDNDSCSANIARIWKVSADLGARSASYAKAAGCPIQVCESARLAGTLSLIGRALLARLMPEGFNEVIELAAHGDRTQTEAETMVFGVSQQTLGAYALGLWAFDDQIVDAVANQHAPSRCQTTTETHPAAFVHMARTSPIADVFADTLQPEEAENTQDEERDAA